MILVGVASFPGLPRFRFSVCNTRRQNRALPPDSASVYYTERKPKNENGGGLGKRLRKGGSRRSGDGGGEGMQHRGRGCNTCGGGWCGLAARAFKFLPYINAQHCRGFWGMLP